MEWLEQITELPETSETVFGQWDIAIVESPPALESLSKICQLFAAFDMQFSTEALTNIPTPTKHAYTTVMEEIAPHYVNIQHVYSDGVVAEVQVRGLKEQSRKRMQEIITNGTNLLITDLYRTNRLYRPAGNGELSYYFVDKEKVEPMETEQIGELRSFIRDSFFAGRGFLSFGPTGWYVTEELKTSIALRTFCSIAKQVILVCQADGQVIGLDLYG